MSKGQATMEYVLIATMILVAAVPSFYLGFKNFQTLSLNHEENKINSYLEEVIDNAELVYYNGLYSKITIEPKINPKYVTINQIYTIEANSSADEYVYYLVLNLTNQEKEKKLMFYSPIPLKSNSTCFISTAYFTECSGSHTCNICNLSKDKFLVEPLALHVILNDTNFKVELFNY